MSSISCFDFDSSWRFSSNYDSVVYRLIGIFILDSNEKFCKEFERDFFLKVKKHKANCYLLNKRDGLMIHCFDILHYFRPIL